MGRLVLIGVTFFLFLFVLWPSMQGTLYAAQSKQICNMDRALGSGAQCVSDEIVLKGSQDQSNKVIAELLYLAIEEAKKDALEGVKFIKNPFDWEMEDPSCWTMARFKFEGDGKSNYKDPMSIYEWMERNMVKSTTKSVTYSRYIHDTLVSDEVMVDINLREAGEIGQINPSKEYRVLVRRAFTYLALRMEYESTWGVKYETIPTAGGFSPEKVKKLLQEGEGNYHAIIISDDVPIRCLRRVGDN